MRPSVKLRRQAALGMIMAFLQERQISIENDIEEIESFVFEERNEKNQDLISSLESIVSVLDLLSGDEFNENMMNGLQKMLSVCKQLFQDDFLFCSILRQLLRMCGVIIGCIWKAHGIDSFACRLLKQKDRHRSEIQNDIRVLQRFAFSLHEIERCETTLERHISHMINESRICDELGCLTNLKETSITKHNLHLMKTSLKISAIQLAVTWQKYAVAKYPGHSDLEAKQLRQMILLQIRNEQLFINKFNEKNPMQLLIPGSDIDLTEEFERLTVRKKITGMLLVVIPKLNFILKDKHRKITTNTRNS